MLAGFIDKDKMVFATLTNIGERFALLEAEFAGAHAIRGTPFSHILTETIKLS